jgi:hypothetical protein
MSVSPPLERLGEGDEGSCRREREDGVEEEVHRSRTSQDVSCTETERVPPREIQPTARTPGRGVGSCGCIAERVRLILGALAMLDGRKFHRVFALVDDGRRDARDEPTHCRAVIRTS